MGTALRLAPRKMMPYGPGGSGWLVAAMRGMMGRAPRVNGKA